MNFVFVMYSVSGNGTMSEDWIFSEFSAIGFVSDSGMTVDEVIISVGKGDIVDAVGTSDRFD